MDIVSYLLSHYLITILLGGACSVLAAFLGAILDHRLSEGWKKAWKYMPAILASLAAEALPETVPGASAQTRWIFGLLSVGVWYLIYPYLEKRIRKDIEAKAGPHTPEGNVHVKPSS